MANLCVLEWTEENGRRRAGRATTWGMASPGTLSRYGALPSSEHTSLLKQKLCFAKCSMPLILIWKEMVVILGLWSWMRSRISFVQRCDLICFSQVLFITSVRRTIEAHYWVHASNLPIQPPCWIRSFRNGVVMDPHQERRSVMLWSCELCFRLPTGYSFEVAIAFHSLPDFSTVLNQ